MKLCLHKNVQLSLRPKTTKEYYFISTSENNWTNNERITVFSVIQWTNKKFVSVKQN